MALNTHSSLLRTAIVDAYNDALNRGAGAGTVQLFTAAFATLLVTLTFSDPAGTTSAGVLTFSAITQGTAVASGTTTLSRFRASTPTTEFEGTTGTSGTDVIITNDVIATNDVITSSGGTITAVT